MSAGWPDWKRGNNWPVDLVFATEEGVEIEKSLPKGGVWGGGKGELKNMNEESGEGVNKSCFGGGETPRENLKGKEA